VKDLLKRLDLKEGRSLSLAVWCRTSLEKKKICRFGEEDRRNWPGAGNKSRGSGKG